MFSRARNERFRDHDIFRQVFERVVAACIKAGLVGGEGFAVDASLIAGRRQQVAGRSRVRSGARISIRRPPSRAVKEYLATLDDAAYGAASDVIAEVRLTIRSGSAMDRRDARTPHSSPTPTTISSM